MGSGSYSYSAAFCKASALKTSYSSDCETYGAMFARAQVFTQNEIDPELDIKNKVRECRDSEEHPNTVPVIIALDVTGSMGQIPMNLIQEDFPEIMKKIQDEGIKDVQVCFMGIGDHYYDTAPIQVGQFESSDDLMEKWLTKLYLEGGGGGNDGESYLLAWYAASRHVQCDAFEKRGKKGILITIGDEPNLKSVDKATLEKLFGSGQTSVTAEELLAQTKESWNVYHINVTDFCGSRKTVKSSWESALGTRVVNTQDSSGKDIVDIIAGIVISESKSPAAENEPDSGPENLPEEIL